MDVRSVVGPPEVCTEIKDYTMRQTWNNPDLVASTIGKVVFL